MKKFFVLILALVFAACAPTLARTKYDKYGHKIEPQKKSKTQTAKKSVNSEKNQSDSRVMMGVDKAGQTQPEVKKEELVKEKTIMDARGRNMGKVVRDGESNNFTMYDQRGRKMGSYVEDENGNGKFYDVRGREISRTSRQTKDAE